VSDLTEQAEAFRKLNDEQLGDLFEVLHWVAYCPDTEYLVPPYIGRKALNLLRDKQQEIESGVKAKDKR